jgi:hypothetical protein
MPAGNRRPHPVLTDSPVARASGPRILFLVGAMLTVAILQWIQHMRLTGDIHGLTPIFFDLFAFGDFGGTVCALLILALAALVPVHSPGARIFRWAGEHPVLIAAVSFIVLCCGALLVYHNHPLSMDEYAAYFQSRVFAAGHLAGQFPLPVMDWLIPPGFQEFFLNVSPTTGQVASTYWPAHALILTPFALIGIPWACNPLLSALTLIVIHRLALRIFADTEAAGFALLLTVASPVFFGIGISYYSMPSHLLANSLYALLLVRPTLGRVFAAGIVGSVALSLHNPVPHMLFAVPWLIWIATRQGGIRLLIALGAGYLPLCALLGIGWFEFSTHLKASGPQVANAGADSAQRLQEALSVFQAPNATVFFSRSVALAKVWVWAVPGLLILACYGAVRERRNVTCLLLAASALTTLIGYLFFPQDQGHGWGYRYFHSAWVALPLLATAALYRPADKSDTQTDAAAPAQSGVFGDQATKSYVATCVLLTLVIGVGFRAWQMQGFMASDLKQLPNYKGNEHRVVIIDSRFSFYGADLVQNDPWLRGNEIRMFSHSAAEDAQMMQQNFPLLHMVYADRYGSVWSTAPSQLRPPAHPGR